MYKYKFLQGGQLLLKHLSFLQNLLKVFITKYLKQEVSDNLSLWVDKHSSCGLCNWRYKDLSMSPDQKVIMLYFQWRSALSTSIMKLLLLPNFYKSSPSVTWDKDLSHDYELVISLLPEAENPMEPFQWCLPAVQIWCF